MSNEFISSINTLIENLDELKHHKVKLIRFQFMKKSNILRAVIKSKDKLSSIEEALLQKVIK